MRIILDITFKTALSGNVVVLLAAFPQPACCRQYKASYHMTFFANKLFCHAAFCKQPRPIYRARALRLYSHENELKQRNIGNVFNAFFYKICEFNVKKMRRKLNLNELLLSADKYYD